jgi:hypothetical protein
VHCTKKTESEALGSERLSTKSKLGFRTLLSFLIAIEMAIAPTASVWAIEPQLPKVAATDNSTGRDDIEKFARAIESGQELPKSDPFYFAGQYVEVFEGAENPISTYRFESAAVEMPRLAFTLLRAKFDRESKTLIIEAIRGANENGENGLLVARQYIPNMDAVALAQDNEILSIIDAQGRLHAVDWGYVASQVFRSPIPVFSKLHVPLQPTNLAPLKVKATYITAGVKPFREADVAPGVVLPLNAKNEVQMTAGDLLVTATDDDGQEHVMGVYDRSVTHTRIENGSNLLDIEAALISEDPRNLDMIAGQLRQEEERYEEFTKERDHLEESLTDPIVALALRSLGKEQNEVLRARSVDHRKYGERESDKFTLSEWNLLYENIINRPDVGSMTPEEVAKKWNTLLPKLDTSTLKVKREARFNVWGKMAVGATAYMAGGVLLGHYHEAFQQISTLNWMYENMFPAVLKDAEYRMPLLKSTLVLAAAWPAAVGASYLVGKSLKGLNQVVQAHDGRVARLIRDLNKNWGDLTNWQRITSFGMRIYSELVLGFWITGIERLGRQKTFFTAANSGVNPFQKIQPDSAVGQKVGITEAARVGLINPFLTGEQRSEQLKIKNALIGAVKSEKDNLRAHAWLLAAIAVSETHNIDIGTLLLSEGRKSPKLANLEELLRDPKARNDWELVTEEIQSKLLSLPYELQKDGLDKVNIEEFREQYKLAKKTAEALAAMDPRRKLLKKLRMRSKEKGLALKHWLINLGRTEFTFLKSVYTNKYVSEQTEREFVSDHLLSVYQLALMGQRANLDDPGQLAASANGLLWTTPQHWTDEGQNVYIHFFVSGARLALVAQAVKPEEEQTYLPREDAFYEPNQKTRQKFLPGLKQWTKDVLHPEKGNIGGWVMRYWKRQAGTIQAYLIVGELMRTSLGNQTAEAALMGMAIAWFAQSWFFGWVWWPLQVGNRQYENHFEEVNKELNSARRHLAWADRESNPEKAAKYLEQGITEMRALYEKYNQKALAELKAFSTRDEEGQALLELSTQNAPVASTGNIALMEIMPGIGAFLTTFMAVPLTAYTFDPANLHVSNLAEWMVKSVIYTSIIYAFLGEKAYHLRKNPKLFLDKFKLMMNNLDSRGCEPVLAGDAFELKPPQNSADQVTDPYAKGDTPGRGLGP